MLNKEMFEVRENFRSEKIDTREYGVPMNYNGRWLQRTIIDEDHQWEAFASYSENAVTIVPFSEAGNLFVEKILRFPPIENGAQGRIMLELPGGDVGEDETPEAGVRRELMEEGGIEIGGEIVFLGSVPVAACHTALCVKLFVAYQCRKVAEPALDFMEETAGLEILELSRADLKTAFLDYQGHIDVVMSHVLLYLQLSDIISFENRRYPSSVLWMG